MTNYSNLTNNELLAELTQLTTLLTPEEISDIEEMNINMQPKISELNSLKRMLLTEHTDKSIEYKEQALTKALVRTKMMTGSSLSLDENGKLNLMKYFSSDVEPDKKMMENFKFMAILTNISEVDLEIMIIKSAFKQILSLPGSTLKELDSNLIIEIKRRVLGIKPISENEVSMLKI